MNVERILDEIEHLEEMFEADSFRLRVSFEQKFMLAPASQSPLRKEPILNLSEFYGTRAFLVDCLPGD
ncbi:MAG TPA: hypothetical protein VNZ03_32570 [Terriglobales bacterium]|jgi:hypothetical protein|nr:hypothetical protein [Terriglobales bacterium]